MYMCVYVYDICVYVYAYMDVYEFINAWVQRFEHEWPTWSTALGHGPGSGAGSFGTGTAGRTSLPPGLGRRRSWAVAQEFDLNFHDLDILRHNMGIY